MPLFNELIVLLALTLSPASTITSCSRFVAEGKIKLDDQNKIWILLNEDTHQEMMIQLNSKDPKMYRCALKNCLSSVELLELEKIPKTLRFYKSKASRLIETIEDRKLSHYSKDCSFIK